MSLKTIIQTAALALLTAGSMMTSKNAQSQCVNPGSYFIEDYSSVSSWKQVNTDNGKPVTGNGSCKLVGSTMDFDCVKGGVENRIYRDLPGAGLDNVNWTADFSFSLNPNSALVPNAAGHYLLAFTSNNSDPMHADAGNIGTLRDPISSAYPVTNNNLIGVQLEAPQPATAVSAPYSNGGWLFSAITKLGGGAVVGSATIPYPTVAHGTYYIRIQRTWSGAGILSIFWDANYSQQIPGSPVCFQIDPNIQNLNIMQMGVNANGINLRSLSGTEGLVKISNSLPCPTVVNPVITIIPSCTPLTPTVSGSLSTIYPTPSPSWSASIDNIWSIVEVDVNGNVIPGNTWWSAAKSGMPGIYSFPLAMNGGPNFIQCGHTYVISLVIQNCGNPYTVAYQNYTPVCLTAGPDRTICAGLATPLTATGNMTWYTWSPAIGLNTTSGATVYANPATTTTYTVWGTIASGTCNEMATVTVTVAPMNLALDISTGMRGSSPNGISISSGQPDDTWQITGTPGHQNYSLGAFAWCVSPVLGPTGAQWWATAYNHSSWISNIKNSDGTPNFETQSTTPATGFMYDDYQYATQFTLPIHYTGLQMSITNAAADNALKVYLNTNLEYDLVYNGTTDFTTISAPNFIENNQSHFHYGPGSQINTITARVYNDNSDAFNSNCTGTNNHCSWTGFVMKAMITGQCDVSQSGCTVCLPNAAIQSPDQSFSRNQKPESQNLKSLATVYPNPTTGLIHLTDVCSNENCQTDVLIINIGGRKVYEKQGLEGNNFDLDLSDLPAGVYFIRLTSGITESMVKLMKN
jgi:hypothetical protein